MTQSLLRRYCRHEATHCGTVPLTMQGSQKTSGRPFETSTGGQPSLKCSLIHWSCSSGVKISLYECVRRYISSELGNSSRFTLAMEFHVSGWGTVRGSKISPHQLQSEQRFRKFALEEIENDINLRNTSCMLKQFRISTAPCLEKRHRSQSDVGIAFYCFLPEISLQSGLSL